MFDVLRKGEVLPVGRTDAEETQLVRAGLAVQAGPADPANLPVKSKSVSSKAAVKPSAHIHHLAVS